MIRQAIKQSKAPIVELEFSTISYETPQGKDAMEDFCAKWVAEAESQNFWAIQRKSDSRQKITQDILIVHPQNQNKLYNKLELEKTEAFFSSTFKDLCSLQTLKVRQHSYAYAILTQKCLSGHFTTNLRHLNLNLQNSIEDEQ